MFQPLLKIWSIKIYCVKNLIIWINRHINIIILQEEEKFLINYNKIRKMNKLIQMYSKIKNSFFKIDKIYL